MLPAHLPADQRKSELRDVVRGPSSPTVNML